MSHLWDSAIFNLHMGCFLPAHGALNVPIRINIVSDSNADSARSDPENSFQRELNRC